MQLRSTLRLAAAVVVALVCLLGLSTSAASGPITDSDTHYFVSQWSSRYPLKYVWSGDDLCKWQGIVCDAVKQQVSMLLPGLGMEGTIPTWGSKRDFNPSGVNVISINLAFNPLTGTFPAHYGQLTKLHELLLKGTQLRGTIPQAWNNLANLVIVDVSNTKACGSMPSWDIKSMPLLAYMSFAGNPLMRGTMADGLGTFQAQLNTSGCKLCGCLPPSVANSWFIGPQVRSDQPQLASPDCATANACKGDDITCSNLNAASAPVLALGSLAAVVLSAVATLVL